MNLGELLSKLRKFREQYGDSIIVSIYDQEWQTDNILTDCSFAEAYEPSNRKWAEEYNVAFSERIVLQ